MKNTKIFLVLFLIFLCINIVEAKTLLQTEYLNYQGTPVTNSYNGYDYSGGDLYTRTIDFLYISVTSIESKEFVYYLSYGTGNKADFGGSFPSNGASAPFILKNTANQHVLGTGTVTWYDSQGGYNVQLIFDTFDLTQESGSVLAYIDTNLLNFHNVTYQAQATSNTGVFTLQNNGPYSKTTHYVYNYQVKIAHEYMIYLSEDQRTYTVDLKRFNYSSAFTLNSGGNIVYTNTSRQDLSNVAAYLTPLNLTITPSSVAPQWFRTFGNTYFQNIILNQTSIQAGDSASVSLVESYTNSGDAAGYITITATEFNTSQNNYITYALWHNSSKTAVTAYKKVGTSWYAATNPNTYSYTKGIPYSQILSHTIDNIQNNLTITANIYDGNNNLVQTFSNAIGVYKPAQSNIYLHISVFDAETFGYIANSHLQVTNDQGVSTSLSSPSGQFFNIPVSPYTHYSYTASADGYNTQTEQINTTIYSLILKVNLIRNTYGQNATSFVLYDSQTRQMIPFQALKCTLSDGRVFTGSEATVLVSNTTIGSTYYYTISTSGYLSYSGTFVQTNQFQQYQVYMVKVSALPTTPVVFPTNQYGQTVTPTPKIYTNGTILWWNGTTVTAAPTMPATVIDSAKVGLEWLGIDTNQIGITIAAFIMILFASILGYVTKSGMGAMAGGAMGFFLSWAMGLVPFYIVLVLLALAAMIGALWLWKRNSEG